MNLYQIYTSKSVPTFIHVILCILALVFWLLFASVAMPILFVFNLFKWAVAAWFLHNQIGKLLASEDVPFMHESEQNKNYSVSLFMMKGKLDLEKMQKVVFERVVMNDGHVSYQRLQKRIEKKWGRYVWSNEESFDIKRHVTCCDDETPPSDDDELRVLFGKIISKPLPKDISPWQITLVPMKSTGHFACLSRFHHIIGDGISMVYVLSKIMDDKPELLKPSEELIKKYKTNALKRVLHAICTGPLSLLTVALSYANNPFPRTKIEGEQKVAWTETISLPKIKEVKTKIGATINDVVTGCLAGAVRRYLISLNGKCTEDVQIAISINTRPPSVLLQENIPLENNSTGVFYNLPVKLETVLERVEESKKRMDVIKNSSEFLVFGFIFKYVIANLPEFLGRFTVNSLNKHCCLIMSNVPGPLNKMVIAGSVVESVMVWPPLVGGTGMSIAIFSYADTIRLNIKVDTSIFPDPKVLANHFQEEIDELFEICSKKDD